jgi:hypothetical protein
MMAVDSGFWQDDGRPDVRCTVETLVDPCVQCVMQISPHNLFRSGLGHCSGGPLPPWGLSLTAAPWSMQRWPATSMGSSLEGLPLTGHVWAQRRYTASLYSKYSSGPLPQGARNASSMMRGVCYFH